MAQKPAVTISHKLNLVIPIYEDDLKTVKAYVHSTPIGVAVWERYFFVISQTFAQLYNNGIGMTGGQRMALLLMKRTAEEAEIWEGDAGVEKGLVEEIRRLSTVIIPGPDGWRQVPWSVATKQGIVAGEDRSEVENAIVFFIVSSAMLPRGQREKMLKAAAGLWGARTSSLKPTEFIASLPTSIETGTSTPAETSSAEEEAGGPSPAMTPSATAPGPRSLPTRQSSIPH